MLLQWSDPWYACSSWNRRDCMTPCSLKECQPPADTGIVTAPAAMESTSHVLAHGLDLFYTRIAPAASFDGLAAEFPFALLVRFCAVSYAECHTDSTAVTCSVLLRHHVMTSLTTSAVWELTLMSCGALPRSTLIAATAGISPTLQQGLSRRRCHSASPITASELDNQILGLSNVFLTSSDISLSRCWSPAAWRAAPMCCGVWHRDEMCAESGSDSSGTAACKSENGWEAACR